MMITIQNGHKGVKSMGKMYVEGKTFDREDFSERTLEQGDYENCVFNQCDFSNSNLSDIRFTTCEFVGCNLSLAKLAKTAFQDVTFKDCKMLGLQFENCNEFGLSLGFERCSLNHASFYKLKLNNTVFNNVQLQEVDFSECDLTGAVFDHCDLAGATFDHTNLEKTDFRTAFNYSLDPELNRIKKAKFSLQGISGLLDKYDIVIDRTM